MVAPLVGAWIEIITYPETDFELVSLLSWERGLKLSRIHLHRLSVLVAPLVGAWIEIAIVRPIFSYLRRRSSRGSVD